MRKTLDEKFSVENLDCKYQDSLGRTLSERNFLYNERLYDNTSLNISCKKVMRN